IALTNNNRVNISSVATGSLTGTGSWIQGNNSTLNYSGATITLPANGLNAQAIDNTVDYNLNANNQTIFNPVSGTYYHLILSNTSGTARTKTLAAATNVEGNLTISGGNTIFSV